MSSPARRGLEGGLPQGSGTKKMAGQRRRNCKGPQFFSQEMTEQAEADRKLLLQESNQLASSRTLSIRDAFKRRQQQAENKTMAHVEKMHRNGIWSPNHPFIVKWNLLMSAAMIVVAVYVPFDSAFLELGFEEPKDIMAFIVNRSIDLVFLSDIIITFNTAVTNKDTGTLDWSRTAIARQYLSGWFWVDFFSILPFYLLNFGSSGSLNLVKVLRIMRLTKLARLLKSNKVVKHIETHYEIDYGSLQLFGFLMMLLFIMHWLACGWYMLIDFENNTHPMNSNPIASSVVSNGDDLWGGNGNSLFQESQCFNWLGCSTLLTDYFTSPSIGELQRAYLLALIWAGGKVFTTGSLIEAWTPAEHIYNLFSDIACGIAYAYLLGALCNIFATKAKTATEYYENMDMLNQYLRENKIKLTNPELCVNLRTYYRFLHQERDSMKDILHSVCPVLQGMLAYEVHFKWVSSIDIFANLKDDMTQNFFISLSRNVEMTLFAPMEALIAPHRPATGLFIVQTGRVMESRLTSRMDFWKGIVTYHEGDVIGNVALDVWRSGQVYGFQATALTHGRAYKVVVADMIEIMKRPQFRTMMKPAFRALSKRRARALLTFFTGVITDCVEAAVSFSEACEQLSDMLSFCENTDELPAYMALMIPPYFKSILKGGSDPELAGCEWPLTETQIQQHLARDKAFPEQLLRQVLSARQHLDQDAFEFSTSNLRTVRLTKLASDVDKYDNGWGTMLSPTSSARSFRWADPDSLQDQETASDNHNVVSPGSDRRSRGPSVQIPAVHAMSASAAINNNVLDYMKQITHQLSRMQADMDGLRQEQRRLARQLMLNEDTPLKPAQDMHHNPDNHQDSTGIADASPRPHRCVNT